MIVDNDDFEDDDLTGENTSHRTNMFLQPEHFITKTDSGTECMMKCKPNALKDILKGEIAVKPYVAKTRGEPYSKELILKPQITMTTGKSSCCMPLHGAIQPERTSAQMKKS